MGGVHVDSFLLQYYNQFYTYNVLFLKIQNFKKLIKQLQTQQTQLNIFIISTYYKLLKAYIIDIVYTFSI